jgi:hypothetical protein
MQKKGFLPRAAELIKYTDNHTDSSSEKTFRWFVLLAYSLVTAANIFTHEMWRDELHVWMTARFSNSIRELFLNMKYQGHPPLWYLMLYAVSRFTHNPVSMQFLHLAIAVGSAYIFLRFAPFSKLIRLLFIFGYFPLYEYAAISRNYALGVFLLFCFCAAYGAAEKNYFILAAILFCLSMTNAYTFILTICLLVTIGIKALIDADTRAVLIRKIPTVLICAALVLAGLICSALVMFPKSDSIYVSMWSTRFNVDKLEQTFAAAWQGLAPVPQFMRFYWWNTNIVSWEILQSVFGAALLCFFLLSMASKRTVFLFFGLAAGAMLVFQYIIYTGFLRHFGHFFILVVICLWLEKIWRDDKPIKINSLSRLSRTFAGPKGIIIVLLLCVHVAVGLFASVMEWQYPFSQGKNAAAYIREKGLDKLPIVGYMDFVASTVAGYLDRPFYYPNSDSFGTFVVFNSKRKFMLDPQEVLDKAFMLAEKNKSDVLLVLHMDLGGGNSSIIRLKSFTGNIEGDEEFSLYLLKYRRQ